MSLAQLRDRMKSQKIANFFIYYANEFGDLLTNLKIQKLVYYSQAWSLALYEKKFFDEEFEAWVHGPVLPSLYHLYKKFGSAPIIATPTKPQLTEDEEKHLVEVYDVFNKFSSYELEQMTHRELPWLKAREGLDPLTGSNRKISYDDMKEYYKSLIKNNDQDKNN